MNLASPMLRQALLPAILLAFLGPAGAAPLPDDLPTPLGETDAVTSWSMWSVPTQCSTYDNHVGLVTFTPTSYIQHPAGFAWTLHLDSPLGECPPVDLVIETDLAAWPQEPTYVPFRTACGSWGTFDFLPQYNYAQVRIGIREPTLCGLPFGTFAYVELWVQPLHPSPYEVCPPVPPVIHCAGVHQWESDTQCADGTHEARFIAMSIVLVSQGCDHTHVFLFTLGGIIADDETCRYWSGIGGPIPDLDCTEAVRQIVRGTDWAHVLP